MVAFLLALIIFMPILMALPILRALEKGIARKNLFFVILCSLFSPIGVFPLLIAFMIAKDSKPNPEIASKNMHAHKIVRLLVALITILMPILFVYLLYILNSPRCLGDVCWTTRRF